MVVVKLKNMEDEIKIMTKKKGLKGREERIEDDLTWEERKMQFKLREIAQKERANGKSTWVKYGRIQIEGTWWKWDEMREELVKEGEGVRKENNESGE